MAPESVRTTAPSAGRGTGPSRHQRADAKRNAVALVEAAKTVFAGSGVDAPAKEITDLAGVGVGTLYRHFPRRSDLIIAVLQHEIDECVEAADELGTTLSPREALMGWIDRFTDFVGTKRGLASALHSGDPAYDDLPQHLLDRLEPALQTLLARAVDGGYARDDVTAREVLMTIALICQPVPGEQPSFNQRMSRVFMEGLGRVAKAGVQPVEGADGPNGAQLLFEYASEKFVYVVLLWEWSAIVRGVEPTENSERKTTERKTTEGAAGDAGKSADLPSQTALMAAAARAAHLIVDHEPVIFDDELATALLGERADELISYHRAHGTHLVLSCARAQVLCRSRFTEDHLDACLRAGLTQYVILGAGLDSFAYRTGSAVRVFEVDHPATQQWKRGQLAAARIPVPDPVSFVAMDFERDQLTGRLRQAGFDRSRPALVSWLGVTMYLTGAAISQTLAEISGFAPGTQLITDYILPAALRDDTGNAYARLVAPAAAERGEPWLTFLAPDDMSALLGQHRFGPVEHVRQRDAIPAALWDRTDSLRPAGLSVLARATIPLARATIPRLA